MQDAELLANDSSDNEQRFHQFGQIGKVLDKLLDARLELPCGRSATRKHRNGKFKLGAKRL